MNDKEKRVEELQDCIDAIELIDRQLEEMDIEMARRKRTSSIVNRIFLGMTVILIIGVLVYV